MPSTIDEFPFINMTILEMHTKPMPQIVAKHSLINLISIRVELNTETIFEPLFELSLID
jgi:hypothetical protein